MSVLTRKQREIREREAKILEVAREILGSEGFNELRMDRIADRIEYSKGTVYQHFGSREDVLAALALESQAARCALFDRAARYPGVTRERLTAVGGAEERFIQRHPMHFLAEQILFSTGLVQKVSPQRREALVLNERQCFQTILGIGRDALARGELELERGATLEGILFGLWSMSWGSYGLQAGGGALSTHGIPPLAETLWRNYHAMLDGYGWRPLYHEHDYESVLARIRAGWFTNEEGAGNE